MRGISLLAVTSLIGCGATDSSALTADVEAQCVQVNQQSMVETDTTNIVTEARFSLKKVFNAIRTSTPSGVTIPSSPTPMFQELYAAFGDCTSGGGIDPNGYGLKCRPAEESLDALDPFTTKAGALHYTPVALTNRFDLAPTDFSYCGESRIVFWKTSGAAGRASIITEMRTPAVIDPTTTKPTCVPVANFWASLASVTDPTKRASMLEDFYFKGLPGMPFPPVSAHGAGYGGAGQVRLNSFVDDVQWNLREFKWHSVCPPDASGPCAAHFVEQTVKNNPSQLLFDGKHAKAPAFQTWYLKNAVPALAAATDVNTIALGNPDGYNTFESISQPEPGDPTDLDYDGDATSALRTKIQGVLDGIPGNKLTVDNILARTTTQTCGGCHQVSVGANLGGGLFWPNSLGFAQIDEQSNLSPALVNDFIPHRETVLEDFLCGSGGAQPGDGTQTVGGVPVGAPN
ncbi:MAG TPA: hypothetical protein VMJ10_26865 [Kofleriaceae bacterium]|nr:hypothetical protein [Kofleriaceae bacterium]